MNKLMLYKEFFSVLNTILVLFLLLFRVDKRNLRFVPLVRLVCVIFLLSITIMLNRISLHTIYAYIIVTAIILALGYLYGHTIGYTVIVACIYLSLIALAQVMACTVCYINIDNSALYNLPQCYQIEHIIFKEIVIVLGILAVAKIVKKIPGDINVINFFTIIIPIIVNIVILSLIGDSLYYEGRFKIDNIVSAVTIFIAGIIMLAGNLCNIIVLEYYLNVKNIENEKKLQISEISLQYDYYVKLEKDMENIRKISHDIKNHLEALRGENDKNEKNDYIDSIEKKLDKYESYYRTGNSFIDNLLHRKKLEASEHGIRFKVIADLSQFGEIKKEDLCIIVSNIVDNALRECALRKHDEPLSENLIELKIGKVKGFLSISCENTIRKSQAEIVTHTKCMETTKTDKRNHGYGMKNIESTVRQYGGTVSIRVCDDMFRLVVLIPTTNIAFSNPLQRA